MAPSSRSCLDTLRMPFARPLDFVRWPGGVCVIFPWFTWLCREFVGPGLMDFSVSPVEQRHVGERHVP